MIKKTFISLTMVFFSFLKSQILDEYPEKQDFYEGGLISFYKESHDYLVKNNVKECNAEEIYQPRFIVTKEGTIKLIKDSDTANISKNKCAYDISLMLLKNLKNWKAAQVKGGKFGALTEFIFYPKDVMSNYKEGYNALKFKIAAQYPGGYEKLKKDFHDEFMSLFMDYHINGDINLEFYVDKEGHITNPRIYPQINDRNFNVSFLLTLSRLKKVWKPALYSNIPIKEKIIYPFNFSTTFRER
ncbi:hypothetical protein U9K52_11150 [Chryseobacterium sp. MHB01]|uniref:hypothetical protein n=1 Tax=Chryseobacterium sp. MHB01 TaxID=3109433 RepID=UPI002AFF3777|nr:hypothetical protein [Chryseobacterium sp. MHB01]MEA1849469.1 hypothetical protein [Chryseobacterium sp. MHB01]